MQKAKGKVIPRNGYDGGQWQKFHYLGEFVPIHSEAGMRLHKFTWIVSVKIFANDLPSQPFLGRHLYCTTLFMLAILHRAAPFFTA